jgi:hypothetical protein
MPVLFACVTTQVVAGDPPTPKTVDTDKPVASAAAASADTASAATPVEAKAPMAAPAAAKREKLVLDDKTLTNAEVSQMLAQGYRPQKGRGDDVLYCRSEQPTGTRFPQKVCKTADQIKALNRDSKDMAARQQMPSGNPSGK